MTCILSVGDNDACHERREGPRAWSLLHVYEIPLPLRGMWRGRVEIQSTLQGVEEEKRGTSSDTQARAAHVAAALGDSGRSAT